MLTSWPVSRNPKVTSWSSTTDRALLRRRADRATRR
ncbi:Uncharacterised protein [Mycobacteroides abscessus subsp. abscessus]|nr:Uncharacterised protein [Mycobacteroides abscessus subsp. abscessus]